MNREIVLFVVVVVVVGKKKKNRFYIYIFNGKEREKGERMIIYTKAQRINIEGKYKSVSDPFPTLKLMLPGGGIRHDGVLRFIRS